MNVIFSEDALEELYEKGRTNNSKYKQFCKQKKLIEGYQRVIKILLNVGSVDELNNFSFLHYEKLRYRSESSIRIKNGSIERLIFTETEDGLEVELIEIDNTHYGNKK